MSARKQESGPQLELRAAPHAHTPMDVIQIMRNVVFALLPICAWAVAQFGMSAALLTVTVTLSCLSTEWALARLARTPNPLGDWSATITGILLALTLPPGFPLWMGGVAGIVSIGLGKALFGGLGFNVFNPALIGRAFVQAAFPAAITSSSPAFAPNRFTELLPTTLTPPFLRPPEPMLAAAQDTVDAITRATPLAAYKFDHVTTGTTDLLLGITTGATGETSAILIGLCGAYLAVRRMLDWRIPVAVLASTYLAGEAFHLVDPMRYPTGLFMLLSGGLVLGAVFMATDMVGSPVTPVGVWFFGGLIGVLTIAIRCLGALPEGVMYAILLANATTPLIDHLTQPRAYGARRDAQRRGAGP